MVLRGLIADDGQRILARHIIDSCFFLSAFQLLVHIAAVHLHFPILFQFEQLVVTAHVRLIENAILRRNGWQITFGRADQRCRTIRQSIEDVSSLIGVFDKFVGKLCTAIVGFQCQHTLCLVAQLETRKGTHVFEAFIADTTSQGHLPHRTKFLSLLQFQVHGGTFGQLGFLQCPDGLVVFQHLDACHGIYGYGRCGQGILSAE